MEKGWTGKMMLYVMYELNTGMCRRYDLVVAEMDGIGRIGVR